MRSDVPSSNWLKWMLLSDVAGYRPTGMFTSPKLRAPFQIVRGTGNKLPAQGWSTTLLQRFGTLNFMETGACSDFGLALLGGLAELGPVDPFSGDLSLELGLSVWLRRSGTSLVGARGRLMDARQAVLAVSGLDASTEPVPLLGRSPRADTLTLAGYVSDLLRRAAAAAGCSVGQVATLAVAALREPRGEALGA